MRNSVSAFAVLTLLIFTSCDKDISVEYGDLVPSAKPATANISNISTCKDCSYFPTCSGSVYSYSDTSAGAGTINQNYTLQYVKDTIITGKTYQKITGAGGQNSYFNCSSGVTSTIKLISSNAYVKTTNLKANQALGYSWTELANNAAGQPESHYYTIMSKGISRTVSGKTYPDVIYIHERTSLEMPGSGSVPVGRTDYYYAKGIGLVECITKDENSGQKVFHHVLLSANIP